MTRRGGLSTAVWLILAGVALGIVGAAAALLAFGRLSGMLPAAVAGRPIAVLAVALLALGLLALVAGLALYVLAPARSPASAASGWAACRTMLAALALGGLPANLLGLGYSLAAGAARPGPPTPDVLVVTIAALELGLLGIVYVRLIRPGVQSWADLGLRAEGFWLRAFQGVAAWLALVVVVAALGAALRALGVEQTQARLYEGVRGEPPWQLALLLAAGAGLAPLAEEVFFRGWVFGACRRTRGTWQAYAFSAGLFAVAHFNLPALLPILAMGLGLAYVYQRSNNLVPSIVAHGLNNGVALALLYLGAAPPG